MNGYSGIASWADVRSRQVPVADCQTCGKGLPPVGTSTEPATTKTSPFGSAVVVGYHLPRFIGGWRAQVLVTGL